MSAAACFPPSGTFRLHLLTDRRLGPSLAPEHRGEDPRHDEGDDADPHRYLEAVDDDGPAADQAEQVYETEHGEDRGGDGREWFHDVTFRERRRDEREPRHRSWDRHPWHTRER